LSNQSLPLVIAGPILRRVTPDQVVLWLVTSAPVACHFSCQTAQDLTPRAQSYTDAGEGIQLGEQAWLYLLNVRPDYPLPVDTLLHYQLLLEHDGSSSDIVDLMPWLCYEDSQTLGFMVRPKLNSLLHGSCRKPHYPGNDGLHQADAVLADARKGRVDSPSLLMMSGDQIYADDVAGPMLDAVHQVIRILGLWGEPIQESAVADSEELYQSELCYYRREELLPHDKASELVKDKFFGGVKKPIFTANTAHNHLVTWSEVVAMYLLVWSPQLWPHIQLSASRVDDEFRDIYLQEQPHVEAFARGLEPVQRVMAQIPCYMVFDDHDVTDDWNLTAGWEVAAYSHPFSRQIIGNALLGYWLCQAWGNDPDGMEELREPVQQFIAERSAARHKEIVDQLLDYGSWHYSLPTSPKLVVLDTRTHRWRSESSLGKPSGLMDWESLSDLQQELIGEDAVVLVSPAPVFGVKLIETVQRIVSFLGKPLLVDAENWMAHPGAANVMLNIFHHPRTPRNFVILSGDVHYSFVADVVLRRQKNSPRVWQITCSGIRNEFPRTLLEWFDRLDRWLYSAQSPLNWFTKRRSMRVRFRHPERYQGRLLNHSGIGRLELNDAGQPELIEVLTEHGHHSFPASNGKRRERMRQRFRYRKSLHPDQSED